MAAVTTKKPGGDVAVELTFPAVFQEVYADSDEALKFAPSFPLAPMPFLEAQDLQGAYHEQKRKDAHHMVRAALIADKTAESKMLASHANYFGMPAPVLSQRKYANPSYGNINSGIDSARRTAPDSTAPFHCVTEGVAGSGEGCGSCYETQMRGGVLRTKEGQQWGAEKLQARVKQLDAIDAAAMTDSLDTGEGIEYPDVAAEFAPKAKLDLLAALDQVENALLGADFGNVVRFAVSDFSTVIKLSVRFATVANREELEAAIAKLDSMNRAVRAQAANRNARMALPPGAMGNLAAPAQEARRAQIDADNGALMRSIYNRFEGIKTYLGMMLRGVDLQPKDRQTLSRTALKSSGLLNFPALAPAARAAAAAAIAEARGPAFPPGPPPPGAEDFRGGPGLPPPGPPGPDDFRGPRPGPRGPGGPGGGPRFDVDDRARFGRRAGAFFGEALAEAGDVPAGAVALNPFRRAPRGAQMVALEEAPDPVFGDMAAMGEIARGPIRRFPPGQIAQARERAARGDLAPGRLPVLDVDDRKEDEYVGQLEEADMEILRRQAAAAGARAEQALARARRAEFQEPGVFGAEAVDAPRRSARARRQLAPGEAVGQRGFAGFGKRGKRGAARDPAKAAATRASLERQVEKYYRDHPEERPGAAAAARPTVAERAAASEASRAAKAEAAKGPHNPILKKQLAEEKERTTLTPGKPKGGKSLLGLTRATLPKTREGYVELAAKLKGMGHPIRVNSGSQLKSIRANFIKRLGL
jgi:hypothetical protein